MARKNTTLEAPTEAPTGRKYIKMEDLPGPDDILGIFGLDGKTFQFAELLLCGASNYTMLRERLKNGRVESAMVTPLLSQVYYVERISAVGSNLGAKKSPKMSQVAESAPSVTVIESAPKPEKRGRGRPKGSTNKKPAVTKKTRSASISATPRKRGRPRKLAS